MSEDTAVIDRSKPPAGFDEVVQPKKVDRTKPPKGFDTVVTASAPSGGDRSRPPAGFDSVVTEQDQAPQTQSKSWQWQYVKPGMKDFTTHISSQDEQKFQKWVKDNHVPWQDTPNADYDMRGYWQAQQQGDKNAQQSKNVNDGEMHFPDTWKTPYHHSFSGESKYSTGKDAPRWINDHQLADSNGNVLFDERKPITPQPPVGEMSAEQPHGRLQKMREALANSSLGHALEETMPKVADALGLRPTLAQGAPGSRQRAEYEESKNLDPIGQVVRAGAPDVYHAVTTPVRGAKLIKKYIQSEAQTMNPNDPENRLEGFRVAAVVSEYSPEEATITVTPEEMTKAYQNIVAPAGEAGADFVGSMVSPKNVAMLGGFDLVPTTTKAGLVFHAAIGAYFAKEMGSTGLQAAYQTYKDAMDGKVPEAVSDAVNAAFNLAMAVEGAKGTADIARYGSTADRPSEKTSLKEKAANAAVKAFPTVTRAGAALKEYVHGKMPEVSLSDEDATRKASDVLINGINGERKATEKTDTKVPNVGIWADKTRKATMQELKSQGMTEDEAFAEISRRTQESGAQVKANAQKGEFYGTNSAGLAGWYFDGDNWHSIKGTASGEFEINIKSIPHDEFDPSEAANLKPLTDAERAEVLSANSTERLKRLGLKPAYTGSERRVADKVKDRERIDAMQFGINEMRRNLESPETPEADKESLRTAIKQHTEMLEELRAKARGEKQTVGTAEGAKADTEFFTQAKQELGEGVSISDVAKRAQELKEQAAKPPKSEPVHAETDVRVASVDPDTLELDPRRFQYKLRGDDTGSQGHLSGSLWNDNYAGVVDVWRDPADGKTYVVNGHNRVSLAREPQNQGKVGKIDVKYINAATAAEARAKGALINIADNQGTAIDAAKFFRDSGMTVERLRAEGLPITRAIAENGMALSRLSEPIFNDVINERIPMNRAVEIGKITNVPEQQEAVLQLIDRAEKKGKHITNDTIRELGRRATLASVVEDNGGDSPQGGLFQVDAMEKNLALEEAEVSDFFRSRIKDDTKLFGVLSRGSRADRVKDAKVGSVNKDKAGAKKTESEQALELYDTESTHVGEVNDIIQRATKEIYDGGNESDIKERAYESVREALSKTLNRATGKNAKRSGAAPKGNEGTGKPEEKPAEVAPEPEPEPRYKFGNTQTDIPEDSEASKALDTARERIDEKDLAGDGKDIGGNHITVRYGIKGEDTAGIVKFIEAQAPFEAALGKTEAFPPSEHSDGAAPIIAPIDSMELHRINAEIEKHGDFAPSSFPEYKPHATVAYVKPEVAGRYTGMDVTAGKKFTVKSISITDRNGDSIEIELKGEPPAKPVEVPAPKDEAAKPEEKPAEVAPEPPAPEPSQEIIPAEPQSPKPLDEAFGVEVHENFPLSKGTRESLARAGNNKELNRQFERVGITSIEVEAPHQFGLSEQGNINRYTGEIQLNSAATDAENTIAHELCHDIFNRLGPEATNTLEHYLDEHSEIESQHAGGLEEKIADHFAKVLQGKATVPENIRKAFFDSPLLDRPVKKASAELPEHKEAPSAEIVPADDRKSWQSIGEQGGGLRESDDVEAVIAAHGDFPVVVKDVNGFRHVMPASMFAELLKTPASGFVRDAWIAAKSIPSQFATADIERHIAEHEEMLKHNRYLSAKPGERGVDMNSPPLSESYRESLKVQIAVDKEELARRKSGARKDIAPAYPVDTVKLDKESGATEFVKIAERVQKQLEAKGPEAKVLPPKKDTASAKGRVLRPEERRLHEVFTPGNIVYSDYWRGYSKVLRFTPESNGEPWSVTEITTDKNGNPLPGEQERTHRTYPDKKDYVVKTASEALVPVAKRAAEPAKPVEVPAPKAEVKDGDKVTYTPSKKGYDPITGIVQEVITNQNGQRGFHIRDEAGDVHRVWEGNGKVEPVHAETKLDDKLASLEPELAKAEAAHKANPTDVTIAESNRLGEQAAQAFHDALEAGADRKTLKQKYPAAAAWWKEYRSDLENGERIVPEGETPALPGMEQATEEQRQAAQEHREGEQSAEMQQRLSTPLGSVDKAAGNMERESPLFQGSEASPQGDMFAQERASAEAAKAEQAKAEQGVSDSYKQAQELGGTLFSGIDPALFRRLFPSVAQNFREWATDTTTPGDTQRATMRETRGQRDREEAVAFNVLDKLRTDWSRRSREDSMAFWNAVEDGNVSALSAKDQALAGMFKALFEHSREEVQAVRPELLNEYIENYFPHIWERPSKAGDVIRQVMSGKRPFAGRGSFLKKRTIPTIQDGIDMGLKPVTWNPVEMGLLKYHEEQQFIMAHKTLDMMKENGTAKFVRAGQSAPDGWMQLDDKISTVYGREQGAPTVDKETGEEKEGGMFSIIRGHYYAPPDAAKVFNNYVSKGLAGRSGIYDSVRWFNDNLNAFQLGISAFHATTTSVNAATSDVALGIQQLFEGKFVEGTRHIAQAPISPILTVLNGSKLMKEYLSPGSYSKMSAEARAVAEAGGRLQMNNLDIRPWDQWMNAIRNHDAGGIAKHSVGAIIDATTRPVMHWLVPRMKAGAFYEMAHNILENSAKEGWSQEKTRARMQKAWDSVDNRFGQMVYDNLFWNRAMKDSVQLATRSVGWNFGDIRELGGAVQDTAKQAVGAVGGKAPEITDRMAFAFALPLVTAVMGGTLTYMWTGKKPKTWKDYFYPIDANGTRHSIPGYMKDVIAMRTDPVGTVMNKMSPVFEMTAQAIQNRDFYGTEIRHRDDPIMKQFLEFGKWTLEQATPFSFRGAAKTMEASGSDVGSVAAAVRASFKHPGAMAMGQLGFNPAPKYIQNSNALNKAHEYSLQNRPPGTRTLEATRRNDVSNSVETMYREGKVDQDQIKRYMDSGRLTREQLAAAKAKAKQDPIVLASRGLSLEQILNVYAAASEDERKALRHLLVGKMKQLNQVEDPERKAELRAKLREYLGK